MFSDSTLIDLTFEWLSFTYLEDVIIVFFGICVLFVVAAILNGGL